MRSCSYRTLLVGSYSIYAIKEKETASGDSASSSEPALLRWWDAYPTVKNSSIPELTAEEVKKIMIDATGKEGQGSFAIIDVRRGDHDVSFNSSILFSYARLQLTT